MIGVSWIRRRAREAKKDKDQDGGDASTDRSCTARDSHKGSKGTRILLVDRDSSGWFIHQGLGVGWREIEL